MGTTVATAEAKAEAEATEQPVTTSAAVNPAGIKQKIKKQQAAATAKQATATQAKEDAKRCFVSFAGARALLVGAALLFAVVLWCTSSGAAEVVTTKSLASWADNQQCGMRDFTAVQEAFGTTCPADSAKGFDPSRMGNSSKSSPPVSLTAAASLKNGWPGKGVLPTSKKALTSTYGNVCPPQWLPVLLALNSRHGNSSIPLSTRRPTTWQCNPQDDSVQQNGETVHASIPCNWGLTRPNQHAETTTSSCAGAETLAAVEKKELHRRNLQQVVVVRHDEDISWSDSFAAVRTIYEKPGTELPVLPSTSTSAGAGPPAPRRPRAWSSPTWARSSTPT